MDQLTKKANFGSNNSLAPNRQQPLSELILELLKQPICFVTNCFDLDCERRLFPKIR